MHVHPLVGISASASWVRLPALSIAGHRFVLVVLVHSHASAHVHSHAGTRLCPFRCAFAPKHLLLLRVGWACAFPCPHVHVHSHAGARQILFGHAFPPKRLHAHSHARRVWVRVPALTRSSLCMVAVHVHPLADSLAVTSRA